MPLFAWDSETFVSSALSPQSVFCISRMWKVGGSKKPKVQMSRRFIVVSLLPPRLSSFSSFSSQLLWFVLTVDWIVDRVKWNQRNDEAEWKPSVGSLDRGCALSWNPRICSTWKIVENHWKIHIAENKNDSPCANRGGLHRLMFAYKNCADWLQNVTPIGDLFN